MRWTDAKFELQRKDQRELFRFIKSLYDLNKTNKAFFEAALGSDGSTAINIYKKEIAEAVDPDPSDPIELRRGRKAISDYRKAAPADISGHVDLMLHFVESGTNQTLAYGDIDDGFYDSLCSMIDSILKIAPELAVAEHERVVERFIALDARTRSRIGWGYSDHVEAAAEEVARKEPTGG
jgi:hypothetical protein